MTLLENGVVTILSLDIVRECLATRACRALQDSIDLNHLCNDIQNKEPRLICVTWTILEVSIVAEL
jgi:hypothetical protein